MNILNALHTLLQGHPQQVQAPRNAGMLQQARTGGQIQLQNTGNNQPMGAAIQHNGGNIQQQGYTPAQMHQMTPVGHPIPQAMMDSFSPQTRQLAELYQHNPMDPRVMHLDPKMFGYAPDNTGQPGRSVSHLRQLIHGGAPNNASFNPQQGFGPQVQGVGSRPITLQAPHTYGQGNLGTGQRGLYNPQVQDNGFFYNQ